MTPELQHRLNVWMRQRQRARTDLFWLAQDVLGYKDLEENPHARLLANYPKFLGGTDYLDAKTGAFIKYEPQVSLWALPGDRFVMILWPRGHLKTTCMKAAIVQTILNYPDIRILLSTAISGQAQDMLKSIKSHFQHTEKMWWLFPEFCPKRDRVAEFGTQEDFTVPNRMNRQLQEPTVSVSSLGKVISSYHYEFLFFSDMVDKENVKTPNQIKDVIDHIKYCEPLLERSPMPPHHGWKIIEGTRYSVADAYGDIIRREEKKKEKEWTISIESADPRDRKDGKPLWPTRYPVRELKRIESDDEGQYSSQYRQRPVPESSALATAKEIIWFPRAVLNFPLRKHTTIDLHGMEDNAGNDYTVLTTCGYDRDGRCYVLDVRRGRFTPFDTIRHIFDIYLTHSPLDFKIEKDAHARVLLPFLEREKSKRGLFPTIVPLKRDNRTAKQQRIRSLQAWFKGGIIRFAEDLPARLDIMEEILNFPDPSIHDDILDTLADQMQNQDGGVNYDVYPDAPREELPFTAPWMRPSQFLGFEQGTGRERWMYGPAQDATVIDKTGGL